MKRFALLLMAASLVACGGDDGDSTNNSSTTETEETHVCTDAMEAVVQENGEPEEIKSYDSDDYHSRDYWYWCGGVKHGFTWRDGDTECSTDTYTFDPVCN